MNYTPLNPKNCIDGLFNKFKYLVAIIIGITIIPHLLFMIENDEYEK